MKKVVSLLLALVLMVGLLSTAVFAEEGEDYDIIRFERSERVKSKKSDNGLFTLTASDVDKDGWYGGGGYTLTIAAAKGLTITRIEAEIGYHYNHYSEVGVSGDAVKNNSPEKDGDTVTVSQINSSEFSFTGGSNYAEFKNITVYYRCTHIFDDNNNCAVCGKTRCDVNGHTLENGFCKFCDFFDESKHKHTFDDDNNCACGIKGCDIGEHVLENGFCKFCIFFDGSKHEHIFDDDNNCACGVKGCDIEAHRYKYYCEFCGEEAPENLAADTVLPNPVNVITQPKELYGRDLGSTLSQGNMTIVVGVACAAVFGFGGFLLGKKKKPAAANGEDEE